MEFEQIPPVSGFNISGLLPTTDLPDPRLYRTLQAWTDFSISKDSQIKKLGSLEPAIVVSIAAELSSAIGRSLGHRHELTPSSVSGERIIQLTDTISGYGNRTIFMRHGEQSPPEWVHTISNPALRKIRMMQDPFNNQDLLTNDGLVDVFLTAFVLRHIQEATGKKVYILSSENLRAKESAYVMSRVIPDSVIGNLEGLDCVTYKDEKDEPPITVEQLLEDLPSGIMPWNPELVDRLCKRTKSGLVQSEAIVDTVKSILEYGIGNEGNNIVLVLTHSQQIAEFLSQYTTSDDLNRRYPALTMIAPGDADKLLILERGVLTERTENPRNSRRMRRVLEVFGDSYEWYKIRRSEYDEGQKIPFLVSPSPLRISLQEAREIDRIGKDIVDFVCVANELYNQNSEVKELLDRGKPEPFRTNKTPSYLFVRPDLIITQNGFSVCEIETSPFGLALAELLNRSYRFAGFDTLIEDDVLTDFMARNTPDHGTIVYSAKTASYKGQLQFLADKVLSGKERKWNVSLADDIDGKGEDTIYRGFYQHEYLTDPNVNTLVRAHFDGNVDIIPSLTPHLEEKALLSLVWDKRWESFLSCQLGNAVIGHLREVIPPTWIVGQEQFFAPGMPAGLQSSEGLAVLSRSKRNYVLKKSGFGEGGSWAEGVSFLQEKSTAKAEELLKAAKADVASLYIIQEFRKSEERPMVYTGENQEPKEMAARVRITPYFSMVSNSAGELVAIKATGCEKTNYIHASTGSINTAVGTYDLY